MGEQCAEKVRAREEEVAGSLATRLATASSSSVSCVRTPRHQEGALAAVDQQNTQEQISSTHFGGNAFVSGLWLWMRVKSWIQKDMERSPQATQLANATPLVSLALFLSNKEELLVQGGDRHRVCGRREIGSDARIIITYRQEPDGHRPNELEN